MDLQCPRPIDSLETIQLAHGSGGQSTHDLFIKVIAPSLGEALMDHQLDAGRFNLTDWALKNHHLSTPTDLLFTTDSFVVDPLFFPGGDIGKLAVVGTINDLAVMGARPLALSLSLIIEEGFSVLKLQNILRSMAKELRSLQLQIICGDTKVVPRGKVDGLFVNTSGLGLQSGAEIWHPRRIEVGDSILVSRTIGHHGAAILCARNDLGLHSTIESDCHELLTITQALIKNGIPIHCSRDLTRGGLLTALVEIATSSKMTFSVEEQRIPLDPTVQNLCELLGFDVAALANEGAAIFFLPAAFKESALSLIRSFPHGRGAAEIGSVISMNPDDGHCRVKTLSGSYRRWQLPAGELLPRIC